MMNSAQAPLQRHWEMKASGFPRPRLPNSSTRNIATLAWLIWSPLSPHWNCTERLTETMVSSEVPVLGISIQWFLHDHWALITVH